MVASSSRLGGANPASHSGVRRAGPAGSRLHLRLAMGASRRGRGAPGTEREHGGAARGAGGGGRKAVLMDAAVAPQEPQASEEEMEEAGLEMEAGPETEAPSVGERRGTAGAAAAAGGTGGGPCPGGRSSSRAGRGPAGGLVAFFPCGSQTLALCAFVAGKEGGSMMCTVV